MTGLDIAAPPADARIVVAMSGGVDSSVVAALLKAEGHDVVGITLQLYDHGQATARPGACCAGRDIHDARRVAEALDIPHYVLDYESRFRAAVIDDFVESYVAGETPVPCVRCNQRIKFRDLVDTARDLGAGALATGHYVRRVAGPDGPELHRGVDPRRDQSYFLFATTRGQLKFLRFPLGAMGKDEVRRLAARFRLPVAEKRDSQDICFVPEGSYAEVVRRLRPGAAGPGDIVDLDGRVVGRHQGVVGFTVGQRRGLGLGGDVARASGEGGALYVVRLDAERRRVVVGPKAALAVGRVTLRDVNWLAAGPPPADGLAIEVKVRSTRPARPATLFADREGAAEVVFEGSETGVAPGQACVFYKGERVLGGGWIARTDGVASAPDRRRPGLTRGGPAPYMRGTVAG